MNSDFIKQLGNKGDEVALHIMACMANIATIVITKNGVWSIFEGDVSDAELVLVYLRKSVFWDTIPIPPKPKPKPPHKEMNKHEAQKDVYKHEEHNRCIPDPWVSPLSLPTLPPPKEPKEPTATKPKQKWRK